MQTQKRYSVSDSFRGLIAAVISRALADLERGSTAIRTSDHVRDEAMCWINGPDCETYCLALDVDYRTIREKAAALYRRFLEHEDVPKRRGNGGSFPTRIGDEKLPGGPGRVPPTTAKGRQTQ